MDYLKRIRQIAALAGVRNDTTAPLIEQPIISLELGETNSKAHYVHSNREVKAVLKDCESFVQDRFLDELLTTCEPNQVNWIKFFIDLSPEFNDSKDHAASRNGLVTELDIIMKHASPITADTLVAASDALLKESTTGARPTSSQLARRIVKLYFEKMFTGTFGRQTSVSEDLLFAEDLFTPSLRLKRSLLKVNRLLDEFFCSHVPAPYLEDELKRLTILSMFLMATRPLANGITCLLNHLLIETSPTSGSPDHWFSNFLMSPTIFVARRASKDCQLGNTQIKRDDRVYIFLTEFSGCPFTSENTLPFGFGKHLCPGLKMSRMIMDTTLNYAKSNQGILRNQFTPSELVAGLPTAFLVYA